MADETIPEIDLLHVWIRQISPMIWRRLLVRSDSALAALHDTIQIAFGWTDSHLHRFRRPRSPRFVLVSMKLASTRPAVRRSLRPGAVSPGALSRSPRIVSTEDERNAHYRTSGR